MSEERLQKILARAGYGSRRSCEELIISGRVLVNGRKAEIGQKADSQIDRIELDHSVISQPKPFTYLTFNKPRFVLCDKVLGDTRRTVFDMVPGGQDLDIVGRLDFESEGLVILTNDGEMVNKLTHPRYEHEKEYKVLLASRPDEKQISAWRRGIVLEDGHKTSAVEIKIETTLGKGAWMRVIMKEGHKRQIRETAKTLGLFVIRIVRIRIGTLVLGPLKSGEWRELTDSEVDSLKKNGQNRPARKHYEAKPKSVSRLGQKTTTTGTRSEGHTTRKPVERKPRDEKRPAQKSKTLPPKTRKVRRLV
jgi:23S rRNA pseudouridine2605 synthase